MTNREVSQWDGRLCNAVEYHWACGSSRVLPEPHHCAALDARARHGLSVHSRGEEGVVRSVPRIGAGDAAANGRRKRPLTLYHPPNNSCAITETSPWARCSPSRHDKAELFAFEEGGARVP